MNLNQWRKWSSVSPILDFLYLTFFFFTIVLNNFNGKFVLQRQDNMGNLLCEKYCHRRGEKYPQQSEKKNQ